MGNGRFAKASRAGTKVEISDEFSFMDDDSWADLGYWIDIFSSHTNSILGHD